MIDKKDLEFRYHHDAEFAHLTDALYAFMRTAVFSSDDIRYALDIACKKIILWEMELPHDETKGPDNTLVTGHK